jgi:N-acetylmuramoyl-L-alanine amidase
MAQLLSASLAVATCLAVPLAAQQATKTAAPAQTAPAVVKSITRSELPKGDRLTIEFTHDVTYLGDRVSDPDRIYFDFNNVALSNVATKALTGAFVDKVRVGQHTETTVRVVIDVKGAPRYSTFVMYSPYRLVIDLEPATKPTPAAALKPPAPAANEIAAKVVTPPASSGTSLPPVAPPPPAAASTSTAALGPPPVTAAIENTPPPPPLPSPVISSDVSAVLKGGRPVTLDTPLPASTTSRGNYSLARQLGLGISRIFIDPGHGGRDPGAQANGIDESELVLDVSLRLEALLKEKQMEVIMARRTDEYVGLEERTAMANKANADIFVSIHANAMKDPVVNGIETYFLSFANSPSAEAVAARENAASTKTMANATELAKAISFGNKVAESRELAGMVQSSMASALKDKNKPFHDLGVKQAPFVVLIGSQMPSILSEISFVTNRGDALLLKQASYRQAIAQALCDGLMKYQLSLKHQTPAAATKPNGR